MPQRAPLLLQTAGTVFPALVPSRSAEGAPELLMPSGSEDSHSRHMLHVTLIACSLAVFIAIGWAALAQIGEAATVVGTLQPYARERVVAHPEGGLVARVLVAEGQTVRAGQPLVAMDATLANADVAYAAQRLRLLERDGRDLGAVAGNAAPSAEAASRLALLAAERSAAAARSRQQGATLALLQTQLQTALRAQGLALDDRDRARRLFRADATTKTALNQRELALSEAQGRVQLIQRQIAVANGAVAQTGAEDTAITVRQQVDLAREGQGLALQRAEAALILDRTRLRQGRLMLRSPVDGVVKAVTVQPGSVAVPTAPLAVIVPTDRLVVEARVAARERYDLRPGLPVRLRITGLELPGKGWIAGRVEEIAPSSAADEAGNLSYGVRLRLDPALTRGRGAARLVPGMEVRGEIITGRKSVLSYIVNPVRQGLAAALSEK
jgi:adhesin transport system membrane fusion protein